GYGLVERSLASAARSGELRDVKSLAVLEEWLAARGGESAPPWRHAAPELNRRRILHFFMQFMPTAFVDGCWLQCGLRVAIAHTPAGASLTALYAHQVRAYLADPGRHFVADYRAAYARVAAPMEEVSSHSFAERADFHSESFSLPV